MTAASNSEARKRLAESAITPTSTLADGATRAELRDMRAAFDRDVWAGEWNSVPTALDRILAARIEQARAEGAAEVVARVEAIAHSAKANTYRDEACRGVVQLPYASNRYVRLLDDIRAALRGDA